MNDRIAAWWPRLRWFAAEFLVIVTGVLVALALNALYQRAQNARSEATYLALLDRDLRDTAARLEEKAAFEAAQLRDGIAAYRGLSSTASEVDQAGVAASLGKLIDRKTMVLQDATYQDLLSTGNLRLISDRELRDRIVAYYGATRADYDIMNRNNSYFVDGLYNNFMMGKGMVAPGTAPSNEATLAQVDAEVSASLRPGYLDEPAFLWSLPAGAPEWAELRALLVGRIRIAAISERSARRVLARTRELSAKLQDKANE
jgi:hypothetical protein